MGGSAIHPATVRHMAEYAAAWPTPDPWPDCGHTFRPFHTMAEYRDFMDVHRAGLCDEATCHWCADDEAHRGYSTRAIDVPPMGQLGLWA